MIWIVTALANWRIWLPVLALGGLFVWHSRAVSEAETRGRKAGQLDQLQATVKAHELRKGVNDDVSRLSYSDLCAALGGLPDQCRQLRGLGPAAAGGQSGATGR
jgi:hypothetical protein